MERRDFLKSSLAAILSLPVLLRGQSLSQIIKSDIDCLIKETNTKIDYSHTEETGPHNFRRTTRLEYLDSVQRIEVPLGELYEIRSKLVGIKKYKAEIKKIIGRDFLGWTTIHVERA